MGSSLGGDGGSVAATTSAAGFGGASIVACGHPFAISQLRRIFGLRSLPNAALRDARQLAFVASFPPLPQTAVMSAGVQAENRSRSDVTSMSNVVTGVHATTSAAPSKAAADFVTAGAFIGRHRASEATVVKQLCVRDSNSRFRKSARRAPECPVKSRLNGWRNDCCLSTRDRTSAPRSKVAVSGARALSMAALAGAALAACGDDLPRLNVLAGGNGGAPVGGADGTGGTGAAGGNAAGGIGAGGSAAGTGGRGGAGSVAAGGRGGAAGAGGVPGAGGGGRGGTGGAAASGGRGGVGGATADGGAGAGGTGGWGPMTPGYSGCSQVGGVDRIRVSKVVSAIGLCLDVNIWLTTKPPPAGLTFPKDWSLMGAVARPCTGTGPTTEPSTITGSVGWTPQIAFNLPPVVNVDITLTFAPSDAGIPASETLNAQNVDIRTACPR